MKRRRTKDFVKLLETLIKEARKIGLILKPIQVMNDFEIAAKKALISLDLTSIRFDRY